LRQPGSGIERVVQRLLRRALAAAKLVLLDENFLIRLGDEWQIVRHGKQLADIEKLLHPADGARLGRFAGFFVAGLIQNTDGAGRERSQLVAQETVMDGIFTATGFSTSTKLVRISRVSTTG
jgi:hypothetical protein